MCRLICSFLTDAAPVTFSSGAPGSAQVTGGANGSSSGGSGSGGTSQNNGASAVEVRTSLLAAAGTAALGLLAFVYTLF